MDHWWLSAAYFDEYGSRDSTRHPDLGKIANESEIFGVELVSISGGRPIRMLGQRNIFKYATRLATQEEIVHLANSIARVVGKVTKVEWDLYPLSGLVRATWGEAEAGSFWLECRTHGDRLIEIQGNRNLFDDADPEVTIQRISQLGQIIINAINSVTGALETGGYEPNY